MSIKASVSGVQGQVGESAKTTKRMAHRVTLAAVGFAGMAYDAGISVCRGAGSYAHKAEERGEEIEAALNARASNVQVQLSEEAKAQKAKVEGAVSNVTGAVGETGKSIEDQVKNKLASLKIGGGTVIETDQINIVVENTDDEDGESVPLEHYDTLNVQEIVNGLSSLEKEKLQEAYEYESNTKNRVTVLREIEMLLAALEEDDEAEAVPGEKEPEEVES